MWKETERRVSPAFDAWVATVRGTYGTVEPGTHSAQYVVPWGKPPCAFGTYAEGWYA